jgi:hypothetical protein
VQDIAPLQKAGILATSKLQMNGPKRPQPENEGKTMNTIETTLKTAITSLVLFTTWATVASTVASACPL